MDSRILYWQERGKLVPTRNLIRTKEQIEGIRLAGVLNTAVLDCVQEHIQILKKGTSEYCIAEYYVDYNDFGYFHYYEPIGSVTLGEALEYITNLDSNCYDADIRRVTQDEYNDFYDLQELTKIRTCINSLTNTDGDFIEFSKRVDNAIESMREKLGLMNPWDTIKID